MWVRSQDKEKLIECTNIFMAYDNGTYIIKTFIQKYNYFDLGVYSTEEKAMKVLDRIQRYIVNKIDIRKEYNSYSMEYNNDYNVIRKVFQMPKDDEVE